LSKNTLRELGFQGETRRLMQASDQIKRRYMTAKERALPVRHGDPGVIRMHGDDRMAFLQRMSTNDLGSLNPGRWDTSVLTNALARIIDHVSVIPRQDDLLLITSPGRGRIVQEWLQGFIFFQDDVRLEDESGHWSLWSVMGPEYNLTLREVINDAEELHAGDSVEDGGVYLWGCERPLPGVQLLLPPERHHQAKARWAANENFDLNGHIYEILRVEAGIPIFGREFSEDSTPLEVGLQDSISFQKGCYIGQEIIARMHSRGRIPRKLVGLALETETPSPSPVFFGTNKVGRATTIVQSPRTSWIALAVVKSTALEQGAPLLVGDRRTPGRRVDLPFPERYE
jgi:folate-binding protein YgfZ